MPVAGAFRKRRAIARTQYHLAVVFDERQDAFKHIDELILMAVPVTLAGPTTGRQGHQIDAEIAKPARFAQAPPRTCCTRRIERRRISGTFAYGDGGEVDLGHTVLYYGVPPLCASIHAPPPICSPSRDRDSRRFVATFLPVSPPQFESCHLESNRPRRSLATNGGRAHTLARDLTRQCRAPPIASAEARCLSVGCRERRCTMKRVTFGLAALAAITVALAQQTN